MSHNHSHIAKNNQTCRVTSNSTEEVVNFLETIWQSLQNFIKFGGRITSGNVGSE
jgi:urease accessory protein UreH